MWCLRMLSPFKKLAPGSRKMLNPKTHAEVARPLLAQFAAEAPDKLRRHFGDIHSLGNEKFAA